MNPQSDSERDVLVFTPIGRDGAASADLFRRAGMRTCICEDLSEFIGRIKDGAAAALLGEEAIFGKDISSLLAWVEAQPAWSDFPFVLLTSHLVNPAVAAWRQKTVKGLGNVSLLERPVQAITLVSTLQVAMRARLGQYKVRSLVEAQASAARELESQVNERTRALNEANLALQEQIAQRALVEENLRQAQKMEAVGQLTGGLAHDFNNLLAGISGSLELIQARVTQGRVAEIDRYITAAQGAARRAAALTHRLLAFSRRQTLDPKPTNVNRLIAGMEDLVRRTVGPAIDIEVVGSSGLWTALIDPPQLENALLNLSLNARDAMPAGGRITIETANKWIDDRTARDVDMKPGQYLTLSVTDTGTGMPKEVIARAFDPFFTTKPTGEGTGLGLSMIYGFVRQSGGQVRIYSEVGQGTTVRLYLPRLYAKTEELDAPEILHGAPLSGEGNTVLVVDDEPTVRMLVTEVLEELGYTAIEANDSATGLRILQSNVRIDLLVTDVGLPGGMNGRQMADAAREHRRNLKVLFITGYAENAAVRNGQLEPGMRVLTKPFSMNSISDHLTQLLQET